MGGYRYSVGRRFYQRDVEITFDADQITFICRPEGCEECVSLPPQGLTKADLMGDLALLLELPVYQLALPLNVEDQRQSDLIALIGGTTLQDS